MFYFVSVNEPFNENSQRVREGDSIKIKVISTLDVKPNQIRLLHDGTPIDLKKRSSIIIDRVAPGDYAVSLLNLRVSDSGRYEYAVEGAPSPKHLVTLFVEPRQPREKFLQLPQTTFTVGESILLKIDFDEDEPLNETPKWYKNEMLIPLDKNGRHQQVTDIPNRTHKFEIYNLQIDDSGTYEMRTKDLIVRTPEITIVPQQTSQPDQGQMIEQVRRQSSVTIDMNKTKEQPM